MAFWCVYVLVTKTFRAALGMFCLVANQGSSGRPSSFYCDQNSLQPSHLYFQCLLQLNEKQMETADQFGSKMQEDAQHIMEGERPMRKLNRLQQERECCLECPLIPHCCNMPVYIQSALGDTAVPEGPGIHSCPLLSLLNQWLILYYPKYLSPRV